MSPEKRTEITIHGQTFRLRCKDGEEQRLKAVAETVEAKLAELAAAGMVDSVRAALMAAFQFAYELHSRQDAEFRRSPEFQNIQRRLKSLVDEIDSNLSQ